VLRNFCENQQQGNYDRTIQRMVCEFFDLPYDKFAAKDPQTRNRAGRQITMYWLKLFKKFLKTIGEHFGGRIILL